MPLQRKKRTWIIVPAALALLFLFLGRIADLSFTKDAAMAVVSPFASVTLKMTDGTASVFRMFTGLKDAGSENEALREENRRLLSESALRADLEKENEALRRQIGVEPKKEHARIAASVAYFDPLSFSYHAVIDKGARDGVKEGMPVVMAGDIVFGKVTEVHDGFSRVMLISNIGNKVSVKTISERASGVLSGMERSSLYMDLIEKDAAIDPEELVVTSGLDGVYPRGLVVGWIKDVAVREEGIFKQAAVRPAFQERFSPVVFIIADYLQ